MQADPLTVGARWAALGGALVLASFVWGFGSHLTAEIDLGATTAAVVTTTWLLALTATISLPIALGIALELVLGRHTLLRRAGVVTLDLLAAVPSVLFGLFGNWLFVHHLGLGYSVLSGALTLTVMILPLLTRSIQSHLGVLHDRYGPQAELLALTPATYVWRLLLPAARPGLGRALLLATTRAAGETAALLFTTGYVTRLPLHPFASGRPLTVHLLELALHEPGGLRAAATLGLGYLVFISILLRSREHPAEAST